MKVPTKQLKRHTRRPYKLWLYSGLMFVLLLLTFGSGAYAHRSGELQAVAHDLVNAAQDVAILTRQLTVKPKTISIDIAHEAYQKLFYFRQLAMTEGTLVTREDSFVAARLRFGDQAIKVDLRLKGDEAHHVSGRKWSFRVKAKGAQAFMGMKKFSLHAAHERMYVTEWLFHRAAQRDDLLGLRYEFANVTLNGDRLGIYAIEEHFEKRLIEHNRRREGPILRFDEGYWWDEQHTLYKNDLRYMWSHDWFRQTPGYGGYHALPISSFQPNRTHANPSLNDQYEIGRTLLEGFRNGQLTTSQVFDVNRVARYLALCDLFASNHSLHTNQLRFYYNPVISKLELIPFDPSIRSDHKLKMPISTIPGHARIVQRLFQRDFDNRWGYNQANFLGQLFEDPAFYEAHLRELNRISQKHYIDDMVAHFQDDLQRHVTVVQTEYTQYRFSTDFLYANARYIQMLLHPNHAVHAFLSETDGHRLRIEMGALQLMPVEVLGLAFQGNSIAKPNQKVILPPKSYRNPVIHRIAAFDLPPSFDLSKENLQDVRLVYRILGVDSIREQPIYLAPRMGDRRVAEDILRASSNIENVVFLDLDSTNQTIRIKPGNWTVDHDLILPKGHTVLGHPGTRLNLINQAKILSYSPLHLKGVQNDPIVIESSDRSGQGVIVMADGSDSTLRHVHFRGLSNPVSGGWSVTAAVTFYESNVSLQHCLFIANRCEDALNVIRGEFNLDNCRFENTLSDAFDSDFGMGSITNSAFVNCGNDAIDVSGTVLKVEHVGIYEAGDKGISSGENSRVLAKHVSIRNCRIGVASKDLSDVSIERATMANCTHGFAVYQKKAEFGPASIHATDVTMESIAQPYLAEASSNLFIDGTLIGADHENVYQTLRRSEKPF